MGAILCLLASGLLRLGEFFVTKGTRREVTTAMQIHEDRTPWPLL
jgi:hypothetical protein